MRHKCARLAMASSPISFFCFSQHKNAPMNPISKTPVCQYFYHCLTCGWRIERDSVASADSSSKADSCRPKKPHTCLSTWCKSCKVKVDSSLGCRHLCTISKPSPNELGISKTWLDLRDKMGGARVCAQEPLATLYSSIVGASSALVTYDFETRCNKSGKLVPYALTACFTCSKCCYVDFMSPDKYQDSYACCGKRFRSYVGVDKVKEFVLDIFFRKSHNRMTVLAHNARNFDALFILDILLENGVSPKIQLKGRQLLKLQLNGTTLKDYNSYVQGALSKIPYNFGFAHLVVKGSFPHKLANVVKNDYCSDKWPGKEL